MPERFDRLVTLRGDPLKGLPSSAWAANLGELDRDLLLLAVVKVTRTLILPEWQSKRPDDRRPDLALEAAEAWIASKTPETAAQAKATAKACTAARNETFGTDHRIPEAARALAWAAGAKDNEHVWDALTAIEGELLARIALVAEYDRGPEQRRAIVGVLRGVLVPSAAATEQPASAEPVPYAPSGTFCVGQRLVHAKFGTVVVKESVDKSIDVELEDGTRKRRAHKAGSPK